MSWHKDARANDLRSSPQFNADLDQIDKTENQKVPTADLSAQQNSQTVTMQFLTPLVLIYWLIQQANCLTKIPLIQNNLKS